MAATREYWAANLAGKVCKSGEWNTVQMCVVAPLGASVDASVMATRGCHKLTAEVGPGSAANVQPKQAPLPTEVAD